MTLDEWHGEFGGRVMWGTVRRFMQSHRLPPNARDEFKEVAELAMLEAHGKYYEVERSGVAPNTFATNAMMYAMMNHNNVEYAFRGYPVKPRCPTFAGKVRAMRRAAYDYRREHGVNPPGSFWSGFRNKYWRPSQQRQDMKASDGGRSRAARAYERRVKNLMLLSDHPSCDVAVEGTDGSGEMLTYVDVLESAEPSVEEIVETRMMAEGAMRFLRSRYDESEISKFIKWVEKGKMPMKELYRSAKSGKPSSRVRSEYQMLRRLQRAFA